MLLLCIRRPVCFIHHFCLSLPDFCFSQNLFSCGMQRPLYASVLLFFSVPGELPVFQLPILPGCGPSSSIFPFENAPTTPLSFREPSLIKYYSLFLSSLPLLGSGPGGNQRRQKPVEYMFIRPFHVSLASLWLA